MNKRSDTNDNKPILFPKSKRDDSIRLLWSSIFSLAELACDLENAIDSRNNHKTPTNKVTQKQKAWLQLINTINDKLAIPHQDETFQYNQVRKEWVDFLSDIHDKLKKKIINYDDAKALIKDECIIQFLDYKTQLEYCEYEDENKDKDMDEDKDKEANKRLDCAYQNDIRKLNSSLKQTKYLHELRFRKPDVNIEKIVNVLCPTNEEINDEAKKPILKHMYSQGPQEFAKYILSQIFESPASKNTLRNVIKDRSPIFFNSFHRLPVGVVYKRLIEEFKQYQDSESFDIRPDTPLKEKLEINRKNSDKLRNNKKDDGWR
ncbi:MAG: hypothetical protein A2381_01445 [Bdellovibrionales bacterium RIFOXYB1_FULL_37_110]|nr:MAG: hypothetical protein A2417_02300 [Bdellovibrionales bacterium RIFOXYC1_FULL_37_79]OFZ58881.1 MAG: hypothetical protein A2381_01445 [Bdellovibrionales bacterium RIFOXYB1_FULL_37_110]OFZ64673.1 MAG: hypothetical protein A2577_13490 [Bdellovibrionales bacterium RIFOXYD1_FULL_36_51]HAB51601.1 hypothetical protein [Ignavibacteriales bacterium]